ncbi:MAG: hypothetical protein ACTSXQ_07250 [Alphaproteobacteria bacterium]
MVEQPINLQEISANISTALGEIAAASNVQDMNKIVKVLALFTLKPFFTGMQEIILQQQTPLQAPEPSYAAPTGMPADLPNMIRPTTSAELQQTGMQQPIPQQQYVAPAPMPQQQYAAPAPHPQQQQPAPMAAAPMQQPIQQPQPSGRTWELEDGTVVPLPLTEQQVRDEYPNPDVINPYNPPKKLKKGEATREEIIVELEKLTTPPPSAGNWKLEDGTVVPLPLTPQQVRDEYPNPDVVDPYNPPKKFKQGEATHEEVVAELEKLRTVPRYKGNYSDYENKGIIYVPVSEKDPRQNRLKIDFSRTDIVAGRKKGINLRKECSHALRQAFEFTNKIVFDTTG